MFAEFSVFRQQFLRFIYIYRKRIVPLMINNSLFFPVVLVLGNLYLAGHSYFGAHNSFQATVLFIGNVIPITVVVTYNLMIDLLLDREGDLFTNYLISILSPRKYLLLRSVFATLVGFGIISLFFPMSKLVVGDMLVTTNASWPAILAIQFLVTMMVANYNLMFACALPGSRSLNNFWMRFNIPLFMMGGFMFPWEAMYKTFPLLAYINLLNPFIYGTEALRAVFLGKGNFIALPICMAVLCGGALFFFGLACFYFKRNMDHV